VTRLWIVLGCLALFGCDKKAPPAPPVVDAPGASETINGTERIGWEQPAADAVELAAIGDVLYVDGVRISLAGVSCAAAPTGTSPVAFACSARLPTLTPGAHTLELASFVNDGGVLESARSSPLRVTVVPVVAPAAPVVKPASALTAGTVVTADQARLRIEVVADGLDHPSDMAFARDGRLFVAERSGTIRILARQADRFGSADKRGAQLPDPALSLADVMGGDGQLLSLALDPQFDQTRFVFALYTAPARSGEPVFTVARFREVAGTLGDRIVLLDAIRAASSSPKASLRFGPDAKLYAALDEAGGAPLRGDAAAMGGLILRLNADGTTPDDQAGATPIYADGYGSPGGFDWDARSGALWMADHDANGSSRLRTIAPEHGAPGGKIRGVSRRVYALPAATTPSSVVAYRGRLLPAFTGSLLVASEGGRHLLRVALDPETSTRPVATERLLQDRVGGVRAVAIAPDGAVYFATASAIGRLVPDGS
jgi:glucose/arabinose dehydrogenase